MWWTPILWTAVIPAAPLVLTDSELWVAFLAFLLSVSVLGLWLERDRRSEAQARDEAVEVPRGAAGCPA